MPAKKRIPSNVSTISLEDRARIEELTGEEFTTLSDALDQWDREREAIAQLHDENQALGILNFKLTRIIERPKKIIDSVWDSSALMLPGKIRESITAYFQEYQENQPAIKMAKSLIK